MAVTLNFEGLGDRVPIPGGYGGLNWGNMSSLDTTGYMLSGYVNGVVSPTNVAYNAWGDAGSMTISDPNGTFTLNSLYLTAAWNDGLSILIEGAGSTSPSRTVVVDTSGPTLFTFNWTGLTSVTLTSSGGVDHGYGGSGTHFAMDDLTINATAVPEPLTMTAVFCGLTGLGAYIRRRRAT